TTSEPGVIRNGPDGAVWFTEYFGPNVGRVTTDAVPTFTEYPVAMNSTWVRGLATGPDGNLWLAGRDPQALVQIDTAGNFLQEFTGLSANPYDLIQGPDGSLYTNVYSDQIGRLSPTGAYKEFTTPTSGAGIFFLSAGPDKDLWFSEY